MQAYFAVVFVVIALSSVVMFYLFNRLKYYNSYIVFVISAGAFIISVSFPIIMNLFTEVYSNLGTVYIFLTGILSYTLLIMLCTGFINTYAEDWLNGVVKSSTKVSHISNMNKSIKILNFMNVKERLYSLKNVIMDSVTPKQPERQESGKNILEKSVDSKKIIDKMGIETIISESVIVDNDFPINDISDIDEQFFWDESYFSLLSSGFEESVYVFAEDINEYEAAEDFFEEELSGKEEIKESLKESFQKVNESNIEEYIDEAFRLKESGDFEGAILRYLYALDENPENSLTFWIVLDICVMYKNLGQVELAKDILNTYVNQFGNIMEVAVRDEIERNLL